MDLARNSNKRILVSVEVLFEVVGLVKTKSAVLMLSVRNIRCFKPRRVNHSKEQFSFTK